MLESSYIAEKSHAEVTFSSGLFIAMMMIKLLQVGSACAAEAQVGVTRTFDIGTNEVNVDAGIKYISIFSGQACDRSSSRYGQPKLVMVKFFSHALHSLSPYPRLHSHNLATMC